MHRFPDGTVNGMIMLIKFRNKEGMGTVAGDYKLCQLYPICFDFKVIVLFLSFHIKAERKIII